MRLKTTIKVFFQNLSLVWKLALYKLITSTTTILLVWLSAMPIINKLNTEGFYSAVKDAFKNSQSTLGNLGNNLAQLIDMFFDIIKNNISSLGFSIFMLIFVITFFSYFINALADIPVCEVLYGSMSCNAKFGFTSCYIKNFKQSLIYSTVKMFSAFIFDALIFSILLLLINLCTASTLLSWLAPCLAVLVFILLFSFRLIFFACFAPSMVINGWNVFECLAKGVKMGFKHFLYNYATAIVLMLVIASSNIFFAIFSFGGSLLLTLPATLILIATFDMVIFYSSSGMYYYIGGNNIQDESKGVKRLEQQDTVKDLKNLI